MGTEARGASPPLRAAGQVRKTRGGEEEGHSRQGCWQRAGRLHETSMAASMLSTYSTLRVRLLQSPPDWMTKSAPQQPPPQQRAAPSPEATRVTLLRDSLDEESLVSEGGAWLAPR